MNETNQKKKEREREEKKLLRFRIIKGIGKGLFEIAGSSDGKH